jgi:hypothetical protein
MTSGITTNGPMPTIDHVQRDGLFQAQPRRGVLSALSPGIMVAENSDALRAA